MLSFIRRNPLLSFFLLAFSFNYIPAFIFYSNTKSDTFLFVLSLFCAFTPSLSGIIVTGIMDGNTGVRNLIGRLFIFRIGIGWFLAAFLLVPALIGFSISIHYLTGGTRALGIHDLPALSLFIPLIIIHLLPPLGEEFGWRGFALPRIQKQVSALGAAIILGFLWWVWHLPIYLKDWGWPEYPRLLLMGIQTVCISVLITWIFNNTKGSLFAVMLCHFSANLSADLLVNRLGLMPIMAYLMSFSGVLILFCVGLAWIYGPDKLCRRRN